MKRPVARLAGLVLVAGCVNATVTPLGHPTAYGPFPADQVRVYLAEADVGGSFEKLALIDLEGDIDSTNREDMIKKARKEAGKVGANAVVLEDFEEPGTLRRVADAVFNIGANRTLRVLAIRVLE